jgi:hypothetical protein
VSDTAQTDGDRRGGLPEDDSLGAFAAAALPRRRRRPAADSPPEPQQDAEIDRPDAAPREEPAGASAPAVRSQQAAAVRRLTDLGIGAGPAQAQRSMQCTVNVSISVRDRFAAYQLAKKQDRGTEPTNAVVVKRAVAHAHRNELFTAMLEYVRHRRTPVDEDDDDLDGLFGDVPGRRAARGRVLDSVQLPFRPSVGELEVIDAMRVHYGFANRSEFVDAALEMFLPPLPDKRRR